MKNTNNLFTLWKHGKLAYPKVYLVRIYYEDNQGKSQTCLKLGFTKQLLHDRIIKFLYGMRIATGFTVKQYELVSLLYGDKYSSLEHALHYNIQHLHFFNSSGVLRRFSGSDEVLRDTPENCDIIQNPDSFYNNGKCIVPYNYRKTTKSSRMDNVV